MNMLFRDVERWSGWEMDGDGLGKRRNGYGYPIGYFLGLFFLEYKSDILS